MLRLIVTRGAVVIPVMAIVTILVFGLSLVNPVDPALAALGDEPSQDAYQQKREELGLDEPIPQQFVSWAAEALRGDFGDSYVTGRSVTSMIMPRLPVTLSIAGFALVIGTVLGLSGGVIAGLRSGSLVDRAVTILSTIGIATPGFWLAMVLAVTLAIQFDLFPATGYTPPGDSPADWVKSITLPALALGIASGATIARQTRSAMLGTLQADYVRQAVSKGLRRRRIVRHHVLRNALAPVVTVIAFQATHLLGGAVIVEHVFAMPGIGAAAVAAVQDNDIPVIQGIVLLTTALVLLVYFVLDVGYAVLDPRVRPG